MVDFTVSEGGSQLESVLITYIQGPIDVGSRSAILVQNVDIQDNTWSIKAGIVTDALSVIDVVFEGTFVSSTLLEGTVKSPEGNGEWAATAEPANEPTPTIATSGITIWGLISNLVGAEQYLAKDSHLQLVGLPADSQLSGTTDHQGRLVYDSELAQVPIPPDGVFTFQVESLEPGVYLIAAQRLQGYPFDMTPLLIKETTYVRVEIPERANLPLSFDLGEVKIPVP